jgi:hypothetical protein
LLKEEQTLGYCPGTSIGALAEGRTDAFWGILGMLAGAGLFAELFPAIRDSILTLGREGSITLPEVLGLNDWIVIVLFVAMGLGLFAFLEKKKL